MMTLSEKLILFVACGLGAALGVSFGVVFTHAFGGG